MIWSPCARNRFVRRLPLIYTFISFKWKIIKNLKLFTQILCFFFVCARVVGARASFVRAGTQIIIAHWIMLWINNQTWLWRCCEDDDDDGRSMKETRMCGVAGRRRRRPTDISVPWSFRVSRFYLTRFHDVHSHSWTAKQFTRSKRKKKKQEYKK